MGREPQAAMAPFVQSLNEFHASTAPSDWLESLVKIYVGDGIARDFYLEVSRFVDPETGGLIRSVFTDRGQADFVADGGPAGHRGRSDGGRAPRAVGPTARGGVEPGPAGFGRARDAGPYCSSVERTAWTSRVWAQLFTPDRAPHRKNGTLGLAA